MRKITKYILTFLIILVVEPCASSAFSKELKNWTRIDPSTLKNEMFQCANNSQVTWVPEIISDTLSIRNETNPYADIPIPVELDALGIRELDAYLEYPDGWLVARDNGEWGGSLEWVTKDGASSVIINENTGILVKTGNSVLAAGGNGHSIVFLGDDGTPIKVDGEFSTDEGFVSKLERTNTGAWKVAKNLPMDTAIDIVLPTKFGDFLAIGSEGLRRFNFEDGIVSKYTSRNWLGLYPQAAVQMPNGEILIGMRHALSALHETNAGWKEKWLVSHACPYLKKLPDEVNCECSFEKP